MTEELRTEEMETNVTIQQNDMTYGELFELSTGIGPWRNSVYKDQHRERSWIWLKLMEPSY